VAIVSPALAAVLVSRFRKRVALKLCARSVSDGRVSFSWVFLLFLVVFARKKGLRHARVDTPHRIGTAHGLAMADPVALVLPAAAVRDLLCIFGIPDAVATLLPPDVIKSAYLDDHGKLAASVVFPPAVATSLRANGYDAYVTDPKFQLFVFTALGHGVWPEDVAQLLKTSGCLALPPLVDYLMLEPIPQKLIDLADASILPSLLPPPAAGRRSGAALSDFHAKPTRLTLMRVFLNAILPAQTPIAPLGTNVGGSPFQDSFLASANAFSDMATAFGKFIPNQDDVTVARSKYDEMCQSFCQAHRNGIPLHESSMPTRTLISKVLKQKLDNTFDAIPLKFCFARLQFEKKGLSTSKTSKVLRMGSGLAVEVSETEDDYTRYVQPSDFLDCLRVLGAAYAICEIVSPVMWSTHIDAIAEKVRNFPNELPSIILCEHRLRQRWSVFFSQMNTASAPSSLGDAIAHFASESIATSFWFEAMFQNPDTRLKQAPGPGYGPWTPPSRQKKGTSGPYAQGPKAPKSKPPRPGKGPGTGKDKGKGKGKGKDTAVLMGYTGPFKFSMPDGSRICFRGVSSAGCTRDTSCPMAGSHGVCPLPACNRAKHCCETTHPELWGSFASAVLRR